jgi:hypothetical protein
LTCLESTWTSATPARASRVMRVPTGFGAPGLVIALLMPLAHAWCCRACSKCMCSIYGSCPATKAVPLLDVPLRQLSTAGVAAFVDSLRPGGTRDTCPPGCKLTPLLNGSIFAERELTGARLIDIVRQHEEGLPSSAVHNSTIRARHVEWLASLRLVPAHALPAKEREERLLGLLNRLREAVHLQQQDTTNLSVKRSLRALRQGPSKRYS